MTGSRHVCIVSCSFRACQNRSSCSFKSDSNHTPVQRKNQYRKYVCNLIIVIVYKNCEKTITHLPTAPLHGDPGGIRTHDPPLRRRLLYPAELLSHTIWSGQPDSNWRPPAPKAGALPTALCPVTLRYFITYRPFRQEENFFSLPAACRAAG